VVDGEYGRRVVLTGPWDDAMRRVFEDTDVRELEINYANGWEGDDIAFVADLPPLAALTVTDRTIEDVSPIHQQPELLSLEVNTYCRTEIDFSTFSRLESCGLEWRPRAKSLFDSGTIRRLFINGYTVKSSAALGRMEQLEDLQLAGASLVEVSSLAGLSRLTALSLRALDKLESLDGIQGLGELERLEIEECRRVRTIDELEGLSALRRLHLNDDTKIASLRPLAGLPLETVLLYGDTDIEDGELSVLLDLPKLRQVAFQERAHYDCDLAAFAAKGIET
jgi:Leucine-rich repeat (LRR) protein